MTARLIITVAGLFSKEVDYDEMFAALCPWTASKGKLNEKAKRREAIIKAAKAEATSQAFERWKSSK